MLRQEKIALIRSSYLFKTLSEEELQQILSIAEEVSSPKNTTLLRDGEVSSEIYLVLSGKVAVVKNEQQLAILESGAVIGEMSLIDRSPRSASVITLEDSKFLVLSLTQQTALYNHILQNLSKQVSQRLRNTNEFTVKALQAELEGAKIRVEMGRFLFKILVILGGWIFVSTAILKYEAIAKNNVFVSTPIIIMVFLASVYQVKTSIYPRSFYGLTLNKWKKNALEGLLFTLPILFLGVLIKVLLIAYVPRFNSLTIFNPNLGNPAAFTMVYLLPFIYALATPLQEFVARGTLQSCIGVALSGKNKVLWSIIVANLLFAAFHAYLSPVFALAAFLGGIFWGWLYARQGSLVGCSISHALIGVFFLTVLDLHHILAGS